MLKSLLNDLSGQLAPGDALIIVPPVAQTDIPSMAAHLLQAWCRLVGITVSVFYANLHFSDFIGSNFYNLIAKSNNINFIGERLFCSSVFDLPPMGKDIHRLIDPDWVPDHLWQRRNEIASRKVSETLTPIRRWILSVDWRQAEKQACQWIKSTARQITRMGYRVVGCTNTLGGVVPPIALLHHVKQANPNIITVLGGALCEGEMSEGILSLNAGIDYIFSGESDKTFPVFLQDILAGKRPKGKIIIGKEIADLDKIPRPDYGEFFRQAENVSLETSYGNSFPILYETSRGCRWMKCNFCGLTGARKSHHIKSPGKVLADLEQLVNQYPASPIHMADNLMPVQYFNTLFPQITRRFPSLRIRYEVNARLTLAQVMELKQAGITRIQPGIESLSSSLLKRMRKNTTFRQNIALLRYCRAVGIDARWNLLFGIPGDQVREYEEILKLLPLIRHLQPPETMPPVKISRFSRYQMEPAEFGISNLLPAELYQDVLPEKADLEKIAFYFSGNFKAQSYEHPHILSRLRSEYHTWLKDWKMDEVNPWGSRTPKLHLRHKSKSPGEFVLHDTRGLPNIQETLVVDKKKADILLVGRPWNDSPILRWALDAQLGILDESWFIPLVTAEPKLLQEFECRTG